MGTSRSAGAEIVSKVLKASRLRTVHEGVGGLWEKMPSVWSWCARRSCWFTDTLAHSRVERKVRADVLEPATPLLVAQIEVVLPDEARADLDAIATAGRRVADGDAGVLAALADDHDTEALIERLDLVLSSKAFERLNDLEALRRRQTTHKAVVVLRDPAKNKALVIEGTCRHLCRKPTIMAGRCIG